MATTDLNSAAVERYKKSVVIDLTAENDLHVTINGEHYINDMTAFAMALNAIINRNEYANRVLGPAPAISEQEFLHMAAGRNADGSEKTS